MYISAPGKSVRNWFSVRRETLSTSLRAADLSGIRWYQPTSKLETIHVRSETGPIGRVGRGELSAAQLDVADAEPIPGELFAWHFGQTLHRLECGVQQATRLVGISFDLRPARQPWGDGRVA